MKHGHTAGLSGILLVLAGLLAANHWPDSAGDVNAEPSAAPLAARPTPAPLLVVATETPDDCSPDPACSGIAPTVDPLSDGREPTLAPPEMLRLPPAGEILTVQIEVEQAGAVDRDAYPE